jgi:hypothetical protein
MTYMEVEPILVESNATLLNTGEPVTSQTVEYTEGSDTQSPYFIPSSMCDDTSVPDSIRSRIGGKRVA